MKELGFRKTLVMLAILSTLLLVCLAANAETSGKCGNNLTWTLDDAGTLTISGTGDMHDYDMHIRVCPWRTSVKEAVILQGVTSISTYAFYDCDNMTSISIPSSVTSIGNYAFQDCGALESVEIPSSVTSIGYMCFIQCRALVNVEIPSSITSISDGMFVACSSLDNVVIPNGITEIESGAFQDCKSLTTIYIPSSLTTVGTSAFLNCTLLETVYYQGSVTDKEKMNINDNRFKNAWWVYASHTVTFNANGGTVSTTSKTVTNGSTYGDLPTPTRNGYSFDGWFTSASGGMQITSSTIVNIYEDKTLYAHWTYAPASYTVTFNANGGTGTPSSQTKEEDVALTLSSYQPSKKYIIQYNANGGSVSPASKNVDCSFNNWNTSADGSGDSYAPGGSYTANADVTLYAQWTDPVAGTLATPSRSGYDFDGWYTSASGGTKITDSTTVTNNMTVYAHWTEPGVNPYNLGDETYSFENYSDSDMDGHCFGMSMTSAGYYNNLLDIRKIGGNASTPLYSFGQTPIVMKPICYYAHIQGTYRENATVAGGSAYLNGWNDIDSDWREVVSYVRNHQYDGTGLLQIGFKKGLSGHAINFLRYENVNGQDRIYAYDNNFPTQETYFYRDSSGNVRQAPVQTFDVISCIALRDVRIYFRNVKNFDSTHVLYMPKDAAIIEGYSYSYLDGGISGEEYVMYEIPADQDGVIITPKRDNADFIYMDTEYSFGKITDETRGELVFATMNEGAVVDEADFRIYEVFGEADLTLPSSLQSIEESAFEGIEATSVYVPDSCTSIGAYAFKNAAVTKIRIPEKCTIADTAFEGCDSVEVFGTPGSAAEAFCDAHDNCIFVAE